MLKIDKHILELISVISEILDIEEDEMLYHGWRVAFLVKSLAKQLRPEMERELFIAGLIHDFGSFDLSCRDIHIGHIHTRVRDKRILLHPIAGAKNLSAIPSLIGLARIVMEHHERWDGQGYPLQLEGEQIDEGAQLLRMADSISEKFYLIKLANKENMIKYLEQESGKEFNPILLEGAKKVFDDPNVIKIASDVELLQKEVEDYMKELEQDNQIEKEADIEKILNFFGHLLDTKNAYTVGHSMRVSDYAVMIALALGVRDKQLETIRVAGILHDIGKIGIPRRILEKPGPLTTEEFGVIEKHPDMGVKIIEKVSIFKELIPILGADQEHFDGTGYPHQLKGEAIPLPARIIFIADAFDAMTSDRPYRKALPLENALGELEKCAGKDFDPHIVDIACKLFGAMNLP